ncbi:MAG: NUDIX domain-containing protein [Acidobacteriaceae bacterium]
MPSTPSDRTARIILSTWRALWAGPEAACQLEKDAPTRPQRIDYSDSAEAPKANSLVPAVNVVVVNHAGEILLIRRTDNGNWAVPGGAIDLGESVAQAAVRETLEESGIHCAITASSASTPTPST